MNGIAFLLLVISFASTQLLSMEQPPKPPVTPTVYPMASLQGLPRELKQHILSFTISGNFQTARKSIAYLGATCKSWNTLTTDGDCMLPVLQTIHYPANAVQLANYLQLKNDQKLQTWISEAAKRFEKGKKLLKAVTEGDCNKVISLLKNKNLALYAIGQDVFMLRTGHPSSATFFSALLQAVQNEYVEVVQLLLSANIDINYDDDTLSTALRSGNEKIVAMLLNAGAPGTTLLACAARKGQKSVVATLRKAGATLNRHDSKGETILIREVTMGVVDLEAIETYIKAGADVNFPDKNGKTALMLAVSDRRKSDIVKELLRKGANPNLQDKDGRTAAMYIADHLAGEQGLYILWRYNADFTLRDNSGQSAYDIARKAGAAENVKAILKYLIKQKTRT